MDRALARLAGDGVALDSPALQDAIDAAAAAGGGTVRVPAGRYRCGTIRLRSRITLHLDPGAVLVGSADIADYPATGVASPDRDRHPHHFLLIEDCTDVRLCGGGTIDGNGAAFWHPRAHDRAWIYAKSPRVSPMLEIRHSANVCIDDVTLRESAGWTLHAFCCDRLRLRGVRVANHLYGPNNDGFDLNGCRDVFVSDCSIETCDDAIVLKTSRDARSCERVVIQNCILRSHCAAIKCGTESWHDFRQITVSNCVVHRSNRAFALYAFDGGTIEQVAVSNLVADTDLAFVFNHPLHFDTRRRTPDSRLSRIRDVRVAGFSCCTDGRLLLTAADGCELTDITLRDVSLRYALLWDPQALAPGVTSNQCSKHSPAARGARAALVADGVERLDVVGLHLVWPNAIDHPGWGEGLRRMENGSDRVHGPADRGDDVPFHAAWLRACRDVALDAATLRASASGVPAVLSFP